MRHLPWHAHGIKKFLLLILILGVYATYVVSKFGVHDGLSATALTWAFFVTCTPIADAGFIIDFPVRVLLGVKMIWAELAVWLIAGGVVIYNLLYNAMVFESMAVLQLFKEILTMPWPLWMIIVTSAVGTFLSIYIGDQIYTLVQQHRHRHTKHKRRLQRKRLIIELIIFFLVVAIYFLLLEQANIHIG